jgi:hypothetical protein
VRQIWCGKHEGNEAVVSGNFFMVGAHRGEGSMVGGLDGGGKCRSDSGESPTAAGSDLMLLLPIGE